MKKCAVMRFGGYGDFLQASSILSWLSERYEVTFITTPKGKDVLSENPHITHWIIVEEGSIPGNKIHEYVASNADNFDRFINLCEVTEASAIAYPERMSHTWNHNARHQYFNHYNYMDLLHVVADVPCKPNIMFYPTATEIEWAKSQRTDKPTILWVLSGSSFHKAYPYTDQVVARLMLETDANLVFCGDLKCKLLENGWQDEKRITCTSGEWSIRDTLAFAQVADVVVGPETGVLNSVGFNSQIHSIVLLSHSSKFNLCKGWKNFTAIEPVQCPCYPCHQIHFTRDDCEDSATGGAKCASNIHPAMLFNTIKRHL